MSALLQLENAFVRYPVVSSSKQVSILGAVANSLSFGKIGKDKSGLSFVQGLSGINLKLTDGARLGVVGRNGSGKSTLLRTLAGIHFPSPGRRIVHGTLSSVLQVGAGLDMEKTGRQNVVLIQRLFGADKDQIAAVVDDVSKFTELGDFFDLPVRTYSSGMLVRLSFAIATTINGDILIVDEILGAGDLHFLERAAERITARSEDAKILVMATHNPVALDQFCDHAIWVHGGRIIEQGKPSDIWAAYSNAGPNEFESNEKQRVVLGR